MAPRSANINVRVEPDIKVKAEAILDRLGISASALINMTYRQVILHKGIPFSVAIPQGLPTRDGVRGEAFEEMIQGGIGQVKAGEAARKRTEDRPAESVYMQAFGRLDAARAEIGQYLPEDFDPDKELEEARAERYGSLG